MKHFLDTTETIEKGLGFKHFGVLHLTWLALFLIITVLMSAIYIRSSDKGKRNIRYIVAFLLVADEIYKYICLGIGGNFMVKYLPFHLCSINIFVIAAHSIKPSKLLDNFLYAICIPASLAALLFPTWTKLPLNNFMHIHSFTVHILLALYPIMLTAGKSFKLEAKQLPKCIMLLLFFCIPAHILNILYDTNFMFLTKAGKSNPLYIFEKLFGNHLIGYPIIAAAVFFLMYFPPYLWKKYKEKKALKLQ